MARKVSNGSGALLSILIKKDLEDIVRDLIKETIVKNIVDKEDVNSI
jgi:hypothetical protein